MESIYEIAKYYLIKEPMTHKKLQKMCYYSQAWYLALKKVPLMDAEFQAWAHGPVSPELWHKYKVWGGLRISSYEGFPEFKGGEKIMRFLDKIYLLYGKYTGEELEELTHEEEPWLKARGGIPEGIACRNRISERDMRKFYREILYED